MYRSVPVPAVRDIVFAGGRVLPVADAEGRRAAPIDAGVVVVREGRIAAVGPASEVEIPAGVEVVRCEGRVVTPGLVEAHGHLGVHEDGEAWSGDDTNEMTVADGSKLRALDAINPRELGFRDALRGGVTSAVVKPGSGNPIGGRTVAVKTWGRIVDEMVIRENVSVKSALGENPKRVGGEKGRLPSVRMGVAAVLREAFVEAQNYVASRAAAHVEGKPFARDLGKETLASVLSGDLIWDQHCHRADDIATAVRLSEEFGYRLVVNHGTEGHFLADFLAEKGVDVIVGPLMTSRSKVELRERTLATPAALAEAGVRIALTTDHPVIPINFLIHEATLAVKEGLDPVVALESLTINPAAMLGLDDRVGSLAPGRDADIAVWSADPLDVHARAERVYVSGREVYRWDAASGEAEVADPFGPTRAAQPAGSAERGVGGR
ncbi:amidohydrolase [Brevibacterium album]|uniref:amidohydrolase n=1 Tax=Brevibacterium album TaxID=417948 RepID=UPI0004285013|nr:amidohydrolase [Brevibacterium album]